MSHRKEEYSQDLVLSLEKQLSGFSRTASQASLFLLSFFAELKTIISKFISWQCTF